MYKVYFKRQKNLWLLLTILAISDMVELVNYFTTYSFVFFDPDGDFVQNFYIPNENWYVV